MKVEPRHTFSIQLPTYLYQKVVDKAGKGKVSFFIREVLEKELGEERLKQQLIASYQAVAKSQKRQSEDETWDETTKDGLN
jgi:metal-responsive CopG/Arc/MetJ family transcriptional regulator